MHATPPSLLQCMVHSPEFSDIAVGSPTSGSATAHRRQWDRPQVAVGPPTGGSGTAHRQQWDRPQAAVRAPIGGREVVVRPPTGGHYLDTDLLG